MELLARLSLQRVGDIDENVAWLGFDEGPLLRSRQHQLNIPLLVEEECQGTAVSVLVILDISQFALGWLVVQFEAGIARLVVAMLLFKTAGSI